MDKRKKKTKILMAITMMQLSKILSLYSVGAFGYTATVI